MKKIITIIICLLLLIIMPSCGKDIHAMNYQDYGYYIVGIYFNAVKVDNPSIKDENPKVYFNYEFYDQKGVIGIATHSGMNDSYANIYETSTVKNLKKKILTVYGNVSMSFAHYNLT